MDTLVLMILHVSAKIFEFFHASCAFGFFITLWRVAKSPSYLVGVVGDGRGGCVRRLKYLVCSLRASLWRHPKIV